MEQLSTLRAAAQRLNVTPVEDLPRIAGFLASSISSCSRLRASSEQTKDVDFSGHLHKLRTRLSSLLQDRSPSGRLAAAVLIKAYVETIRPVESAQWEAWARGLTACLNKPDPWECKQVYIATTSRIFLLCRGSPTLQREVVSPLLPAFLNAVLATLRPTAAKNGSRAGNSPSQLLPMALGCWCELLDHFSQTFRPFSTRIKQICLGLLSDPATSWPLRDQATQVLCALHLCAPKATALSDWDQSISDIIVAAHETSDLIFRAVLEDWRSASTAISERTTEQHYAKPPELNKADSTGLGPWKGILQGADRLKALLRWLGFRLKSQSQASSVPLGAIVDLLTRINGITVPSSGNPTRTSPEVSRDEREELWCHLPGLHVAALDVSRTISELLNLTGVPLIATLGAQTIDVFEAEGWNEAVRMYSYKTMSQLLSVSGYAVASMRSAGVSALLTSCCHDLVYAIEAPNNDFLGLSGLGQNGASAAATKGSSNQTAIADPRIPGLVRSAEELLVLVYERYPASLLPHSLRTELDRTAILCNSQSALLASVVNPPRHTNKSRIQPSLLAFFTRTTDQCNVNLETLLRPRMPAIGVTPEKLSSVETDEIQDNGMNGHHSVDDSTAFGTPSYHMDVEEHIREPIMEENEKDAAYDRIDEASAAKKRAHGSIAHDVLAPQAEGALNFGNLQKKARFSDDGFPRGSRNPIPVVRDGETQASSISAVQSVDQVLPFAAGDAILVQSSSKPTNQPVAAGDDSDDDSDIPEINPELATDEEDED